MHNIISTKLLQTVSCTCPLNLWCTIHILFLILFPICILGLKFLSVCFSYNQVTDVDIRSESKCIVREIILPCTYRKYVLKKIEKRLLQEREPLHTRNLPQQEKYRQADVSLSNHCTDAQFLSLNHTNQKAHSLFWVFFYQSGISLLITRSLLSERAVRFKNSGR